MSLDKKNKPLTLPKISTNNIREKKNNSISSLSSINSLPLLSNAFARIKVNNANTYNTSYNSQHIIKSNKVLEKLRYSTNNPSNKQHSSKKVTFATNEYERKRRTALPSIKSEHPNASSHITYSAKSKKGRK